MLTLSVIQTEIIASDVSRAGLSLTHLQEEMIDHLCCQVEELMNQGMDFDEARNSVLKVTGVKELKKIQENTILLIDKKYRIMKKTMKVFGIVSLALIAFGTVLKLWRIPGGTEGLMLGFTLLGGGFLPVLFWVLKKESKLQGKSALFISGMIGGMALVFGVLIKILHMPFGNELLFIGFILLGIIFPPLLLIHLFKKTTDKKLRIIYFIGIFSFILCMSGDASKFFHLPGAMVLTLVGFFGLSAIFFPLYTFHRYSKESHINPSFIFLSIGLFFFTMFTILLSINYSKNVLVDFEPLSDGLKSTTLFLDQRNLEKSKKLVLLENTSDSITKATIVNFRQSTAELKNYIHALKLQLIMGCDLIKKEEAEKVIVNPQLLKNNWDYNPAFSMFFAERDFKKTSELRKRLNAYQKQLTSLTFNSQPSKTIINQALETTDITYFQGLKSSETWETSHFLQFPSCQTLNFLTQLEIWVKISEAEVMEELSNRSHIPILVTEIENPKITKL